MTKKQIKNINDLIDSESSLEYIIKSELNNSKFEKNLIKLEVANAAFLHNNNNDDYIVRAINRGCLLGIERILQIIGGRLNYHISENKIIIDDIIY